MNSLYSKIVEIENLYKTHYQSLIVRFSYWLQINLLTKNNLGLDIMFIKI